MDYEVLKQFAISLALASLIGFDRERIHQLNKNSSLETFGGIRTFALVGLLGTLAYIIEKPIAFFLPVFTIGFLGLVIVSYFITYKKYGGTGATSETAFIAVYLLGILCGMQKYTLATILALVIFLILHFKETLHDLAKKINESELISTVQFIIIAFVILPLLPNENFGPYGFFNPYLIWLMVVFISGISFLSYITIKILGPKRGIGISGFLGGLISSTALVLNFSSQSKKNPNIINPYVSSVVLASSAMFLRVLIEVFVLNRDLFYKLIFPLLPMLLSGVFLAIIFWFKKDKNSDQNIQNEFSNLKSPFSLVPALKFAFLFATILFFSKFMLAVMGDKGLYLTSVLSSLLDVDPITISASNLSLNEISQLSAVFIITIGVVTNTFVKGLIFLFLGNREVALKVLFCFAMIVICGILGFA